MRRSVLPQRDVGDLMRKAVRALIDLLIDDQTRADAGGYGHELYIMIILSSSDDRFGQTGEIGVVFEIDRQSGRFAQLFADRVIPPLFAEVGRRQDIAVQQVERSGTGNADALCALAEALDRLADLFDGHKRILGICRKLPSLLYLIIFVDQGDPGVGPADIDGDGIVHADSSYSLA